MDLSSIKDVFKKFGFFREYAALIAPLALAVVAGLLFIPTILMQNKLKAEVENKSINELGQPANSILSGPVISSRQWEVEKAYQDAYQNDAEQIAKTVTMTSRRELLSYNIFPDTNETSVSIYSRFGENYRAGIDKMLSKLSARDCPTPSELESSGQLPPVETYSRRSRNRSRLNETEELIKEALCNEIAQTTSVYINPEQIPGYAFWKDFQYQNKTDSIQQCWYWQLGYWIIEDVIKTVEEVNYGSSSVFDSPVKRIVSISFTTSSSSITGGMATTPSPSARPNYLIDLEDGLTLPLTARITTKDYDAVHFRTSAVLDIKDVSLFISELCSAKEHKFKGFSGNGPEQTFLHNQISVLGFNYSHFERKEGNHELYRYGNDSVVELEVLCEYIFDSQGYDKIKPQSVKDFLAVNTI